MKEHWYSQVQFKLWKLLLETFPWIQISLLCFSFPTILFVDQLSKGNFSYFLNNDRKTRMWSSAAEQIHNESFIWSYENTKQRISKLNLNYAFFSNSKEVRHFYHKVYLCFCITYKNKNSGYYLPFRSNSSRDSWLLQTLFWTKI